MADSTPPGSRPPELTQAADLNAGLLACLLAPACLGGWIAQRVCCLPPGTHTGSKFRLLLRALLRGTLLHTHTRPWWTPPHRFPFGRKHFRREAELQPPITSNGFLGLGGGRRREAVMDVRREDCPSPQWSWVRSWVHTHSHTHSTSSQLTQGEGQTFWEAYRLCFGVDSLHML